MHKNTLRHLLPLIIICFIFIIGFILILHTHKTWNVTVEKYLPLKNQINKVQNDVSMSHLWLEELMSGDNSIHKHVDILPRLKVEALKDYIRKVERTDIFADHPAYSLGLKKLEFLIDELYKLTLKRLNNRKLHVSGSKIDIIFDRKFKDIIFLIDTLNFDINKNIALEINQKDTNFNILIILFSLTNILAVLLLYFNKRINDKYEANLYFQKEKAFVTLNSIGDAVITTDEKGYITFLNPIAEHLTGYLNEEAQGKYLDDVFNIINEQTKAKIASPVQKVLSEGKIVGLSNHTSLISKNKEVYEIEDSASPIRNMENIIIGTVLVFHDVTKQKQVRRKLNEKEKILIQQSKMAAMGEMLENIAHQWRQPLSIISTSATGIGIKKQLGSLDDEFLLRSVSLINDSAQHLSKTIDDFRSFFKPNKNKIEFDVYLSYKKVIKLLSSSLEHKNISLIEKISSINILNFENEFVQVIMNIFSNAIDALTNKQGKRFIFIEIYQKENIVYIKIMDNAGGINDDVIVRIFEPYFTTKHKSQGTGIGLYMTEEIITKHMKGKIKVKNKSFKYEEKDYSGAEFTIELYI